MESRSTSWQHIAMVLVLGAWSSIGATLTKDYCIVGAGPAGLQLGSFLREANRDYVIFERGSASGKLLSDIVDSKLITDNCYPQYLLLFLSR